MKYILYIVVSHECAESGQFCCSIDILRSFTEGYTQVSISNPVVLRKPFPLANPNKPLPGAESGAVPPVKLVWAPSAPRGDCRKWFCADVPGCFSLSQICAVQCNLRSPFVCCWDSAGFYCYMSRMCVYIYVHPYTCTRGRCENLQSEAVVF